MRRFVIVDIITLSLHAAWTTTHASITPGTAPFSFRGMSMSWFLLFIAGLLEVAWAAGLKTSEGFTRLWPSVFTLVTAVGSFALLAMAMRQLPLGTAYAVWTGIGAIGAFVFGIVMLGEALTVA